MGIKWLDPNKANVVITRLDKILAVDSKGGVAFTQVGGYDLLADILSSLASFSNDISERERISITSESILDSKKVGQLNLNHILKLMNKGQKRYLKQPLKPYILLTSLSILYSKTIRPIRQKDSYIIFSGSVPNKFLESRQSLRLSPIFGKEPINYTTARVKVFSRDPMAAFEKAINSIDYIRALWNFAYNQKKGWRFSSGRTKPVNSIVLGPFHTLHNPDGNLATKTYWWETSYSEPLLPLRIETDYKKLKIFERRLRRIVLSCSFGDKMRRLFIRYVRALDERDLTNSYLKLWAILEDLTGTGKASYDATIKRATFLFRDLDLNRLILAYLRDWRNRIVHEGEEADHAERMVFKLKTYVEILIEFITNNSKKFKNFEEVVAFFELPPNLEALKNRAKKIDMAVKLYST